MAKMDAESLTFQEFILGIIYWSYSLFSSNDKYSIRRVAKYLNWIYAHSKTGEC